MSKGRYEIQITVTKIGTDHKLWFTARKRRVYFLFRSAWKELKPIMVDNYDEAMRIATDNYCKCSAIKNHQKHPDICVWCGKRFKKK